MKEISIYICDICNNELDSKEDAIRCENNHCKLDKIVKYKYRCGSKYPTKITVRMSDGTIMEYGYPEKVDY